MEGIDVPIGMETVGSAGPSGDVRVLRLIARPR